MNVAIIISIYKIRYWICITFRLLFIFLCFCSQFHNYIWKYNLKITMCFLMMMINKTVICDLIWTIRFEIKQRKFILRFQMTPCNRKKSHLNLFLRIWIETSTFSLNRNPLKSEGNKIILCSSVFTNLYQ